MSFKSAKTSAIILTAILSAFLYATTATAATVNEILKQYYPIYYEPKQCQGIIANNGSSDGEGTNYQSGYCIKVDRQLQVDAEQGKRLYILVIGDVAFDEREGEASGSHADTGLVGMLVLKPEGKGWAVEYAHPAMNAGSFGTGLEDWKLIQVGPDKWGFINVHSDSHGIQSFSEYVLLSPDPKNGGIIDNHITAKATMENNTLSSSSCGDRSIDHCTFLKAKLGVDNSKIANGFYPLKITVNGHEYNYDGSDKVVFENKVYTINYQSKVGYKVPENYMD